MPERVYICVNSRWPRVAPVLLVKAYRAKWAKEKAANATGYRVDWECVGIRRVNFDGEVAEATPELLVCAELDLPPTEYWVSEAFISRLSELSAEVEALRAAQGVDCSKR